jgi:hypothetical protein
LPVRFRPASFYRAPTHADAHLLATMKAALIRTNADLGVATAQARRLREAMEQMATADLAAATEARDGTSCVQVLAVTCRSLDALCEAYEALRTMIERRTGASQSGGSSALN